MGRSPVVARAGVRWPADLGRDLAANLAGDLVVQVLVLALWFWHLRSGWLLVVWAVRWVVFAAVAAAAVLSRQRRREPAMRVLIAGHWFGTLATLPIVPEVIPLSMFVMVGDLLCVARYAPPRTHERFLLAGAAVSGVAGLLSLQSWTGLADRAPRALFIAFIVGHAVGTGWLFALHASHGRTELLANAASLARATRRLAVSGLEQRQAIAAALRRGPGRRVDELDGAVARLAVAVRGAPGDGATLSLAAATVACAQRASAELREFAHGVFPASLGRHGLPPALRALAARTPYPLSTTVAAELDEVAELDEAAATFAFFTVDATIGWAGPGTERAAVSVCRRHGVLVVRARLAGPAADAAAAARLGRLLEDRLNAAGADLEVRAVPDGTLVVVHRPDRPDRPDRRLALPGADGWATALARASALVGPAAVAATLLCALTAVAGRAVPGRAAVASVLAVVIGAGTWAARRSGRLAATGRPGQATALLAATAFGASLAFAAVAPELLPVGAAATLAPLFFALPHARPGRLRALALAQCATGGVIAMVSLLRTPAWERAALPVWFVVVVVGLATAAVVLAVGTLIGRSHAELAGLAEAMRASHERLIAADDEERRRIERDLHDGGQQQLVALSIQLRAVERTLPDGGRAAGLVEAIGGQVREARRDLARLTDGTAAELLAGGLPAALARLAAAHAPRVRVAVADGWAEEPAVDANVELAVYFCCVEAVQNARKHAGERAAVVVEAARVGGDVAFVVRDEGRGFDPQAATAGRGLANLRERVDALGGDLSIRSAPGRGTVLSGRLPAGVALSGRRGTAAPL